ncbi:MAG: transposase [Lentisphaeria bacterium]|nr:transposase [Lentisphaeria bacterium]
MPRRRRCWSNHATYHITHRCHERRFFFKFAKYRRMYRCYLFEATRRFNISILGYVVTSNHVHVLITTGDRGRPEVSEAMQYVHGEMGQHYNLHRGREGSFWSNRFHATRIESGAHLQRCLFYIDMNMVRAGVVDHPAQWRDGSAFELASDRQRYRVVDREKLTGRLGLRDWHAFRQWYDEALVEILARRAFMRRQAFWSDSLAVGTPEWVKSEAEHNGMKRYRVEESGLDWPENFKTVFVRAKNFSNCI